MVNPVFNGLALHNLAKYRVAVAIRIGCVQHVVVGDVDVELRSGRIGVAGARHGNRVAVVFQAVFGFQRNSRARWLLLHVGGEAAALNHEAINHAVKHRAFVVFVVHILQKVFHGLGGFGGV